MTICCLPNCAYLSSVSRQLELWRALRALGEAPLMATHGGIYQWVLEREGVPVIPLEPRWSEEKCREFPATNRDLRD